MLERCDGALHKFEKEREAWQKGQQGISARLVLGGGRGGRIRGAISRSLVVVVMGLGVEGRLGAAPLVVRSTGSVEGGTVVGSTAI